MDIMGLSLDHSLLVVALILIAVDLFFPTDVPTHVAYVILAYLIGSNLPVPVLYQVLSGIFAWFVVLTFHYTLWRGFVRQVAHRVIAPTKYRTGMAGFVGRVGTLREVEGRRMVEVRGDLYPCEERGLVAPDAKARILEARDGRLIVTADKGE